MPSKLFDDDRSTRFLARVDMHLETLASDAERLDFLDEQLAGWRHRYARFICTEGRSEPHIKADDPPHASDFLLTISGLAARRKTLFSEAGVRALCGMLRSAAR